MNPLVADGGDQAAGMRTVGDGELTPEQESDFDTLMLALAVVKPGGAARLLNDNNSADSAGWVSIEDAVASGRAFFVELKDSLAAFDLDTPELVVAGEALARWARAENLPTLLVSSGRDGHRHLYIRGSDRAAVEGQAVSLGIAKSAHRRAIRPPLAPHRNGLATALISPQTAVDALAVLGPSEHGEQLRKNLPDWLLTLISDGDVQGRYGGRSQMALAIASGLRGAGYDYADYRAVMANRTNGGGAKYHALEDGEGTEDPETFLARTWEKAASQLTPAEILERISKVRTAAYAADWRGRTGSTDRAVTLASCELGTASGTTALTFGSRKIAEVAQVEDRTVRKSLGRLVAAGWLECVKATKIGDADTYRFGTNVDTMTASIPSPHKDKCGNNDQIDGDRVVLHPVFRNGSGLGKNTGLTWLKLQELDRPTTVKELAEAGLGERRTVDRHLKKLEEHGLAVKSGTKWAASGDARRLDELAVELGAAERAASQAELSTEAVKPSGWTWQPTGEKFADWWDRQDVTARNVWLRSMGVTLGFVYSLEGKGPTLNLDLGDLGTLTQQLNASGPAAQRQEVFEAMTENGIAGMELGRDSVVLVSPDGQRSPAFDLGSDSLIAEQVIRE